MGPFHFVSLNNYFVLYFYNYIYHYSYYKHQENLNLVLVTYLYLLKLCCINYLKMEQNYYLQY